jgi:transposase
MVMNAYSQDLRDKVIELYKTGNYSRLAIAELLSMCYATVRSWITQYEETGSCNIPRPVREGRRRKFDDKNLVLSYINQHPDANGKEIRKALAPNVSITSFYDTLKRMDITYKKRGKL